MGKRKVKPKKELKERRCLFVSQVITDNDVGRNCLTTENGTIIPVNTITATDVGKVVYFNIGRYA